MSKHDILEHYLNVIYLGNGAYGIQSASERYFNKKNPKDLTIGEDALLAGLIQSPEYLNPVTHPDRAARRRAVVLQAMVENHKITEDEARLARQEPLPTKATNPDKSRNYFTDEVIRRLLNDDPTVKGDVGEVLGTTQSERYNAVFRGGLKIETTFDPTLQDTATLAVNSTIPGNTPFTEAMVVIDNSNGAVRAMVAGRSFKDSQYNLATQAARQTGSSFKGITLATALMNGYSPDDSVSGSTLHYPLPGEDWDLKCGGGGFSLREATVKSNNCAYARTLISLGTGNSGSDGARKVIDMAKTLGIDTSQFQPVPSLTLGTQLTSPLDMAEAYSVFANEGMHRPPIFVTKVTGPDGKVLFEDHGRGERVLPAEIARTETDILQGVIQRGTGTRARLDRPAAGKTGTTNDNADAWFVGYTPQYTAAVWMGNPDGRVPMNNVGGIRVQGGTYPARTWAAFMKPVMAPLPVIDFAKPNENLWPEPGNITENGRKIGRHFAASDTTTSSVPGETTVPSDETVPPNDSVTTIAPATPVTPVTPVTPPVASP
jgi:penicillin-binding protein 1A